MAVLMADRVERRPTLFDLVEAEPAAPTRRRDDAAEPVAAGERPAPAGEAVGHGGVGGESTLDELLVGAWEGLAAQAAVPCPLCEGALQPVYGDASGARRGGGGGGVTGAGGSGGSGAAGGGGGPVVGGRCDTCGTTLS
jgi:hypothetical protein